jgi:hypothetical protein
VAVVGELLLLVHIPIPSRHQQLLALGVVGVEVGEGAEQRPPWCPCVLLLAASIAPAAQGCNRIWLTESAYALDKT